MIVYKDDEIIVINKPQGLATQGTNIIKFLFQFLLNDFYSCNSRYTHD